MIYGTNEKGEGILTLTPEENERFKRGETITRQSAYSQGEFCIEARIIYHPPKAHRLRKLGFSEEQIEALINQFPNHHLYPKAKL